jgi:hypothetical protein
MERAKKLQARGEFTQIYKAAERRLAQGHYQKNFPVMIRLHPIKKNNMRRN